MPASIFSETELASFPEEIPGDDLIRAFTLTGADRDLVAIRRAGSKPLGARASALCTSRKSRPLTRIRARIGADGTHDERALRSAMLGRERHLDRTECRMY